MSTTSVSQKPVAPLQTEVTDETLFTVLKKVISQIKKNPNDPNTSELKDLIKTLIKTGETFLTKIDKNSSLHEKYAPILKDAKAAVKTPFFTRRTVNALCATTGAALLTAMVALTPQETLASVTDPLISTGTAIVEAAAALDPKKALAFVTNPLIVKAAKQISQETLSNITNSLIGKMAQEISQEAVAFVTDPLIYIPTAFVGITSLLGKCWCASKSAEHTEKKILKALRQIQEETRTEAPQIKIAQTVAESSTSVTDNLKPQAPSSPVMTRSPIELISNPDAITPETLSPRSPASEVPFGEDETVTFTLKNITDATVDEDPISEKPSPISLSSSVQANSAAVAASAVEEVVQNSAQQPAIPASVRKKQSISTKQTTVTISKDAKAEQERKARFKEARETVATLRMVGKAAKELQDAAARKAKEAEKRETSVAPAPLPTKAPAPTKPKNRTRTSRLPTFNSKRSS